MNTSDVRDMALTQWAFWVSAASFTITVILITVYFVDVPPLWRWLERKGGANSSDEVPPQSANASKSHFLANIVRQSDVMVTTDSAIVHEIMERDTPGRDKSPPLRGDERLRYPARRHSSGIAGSRSDGSGDSEIILQARERDRGRRPSPSPPRHEDREAEMRKTRDSSVDRARRRGLEEEWIVRRPRSPTPSPPPPPLPPSDYEDTNSRSRSRSLIRIRTRDGRSTWVFPRRSASPPGPPRSPHGHEEIEGHNESSPASRGRTRESDDGSSVHRRRSPSTSRPPREFDHRNIVEIHRRERSLSLEQ
jgi:hypothetical protein